MTAKPAAVVDAVTGREVAVCVGGPRDGWGYYETDLETQLAAATSTGTRFDYERTDQFRTHRDGVARIWRFTGTDRPASPSTFDPDVVYWHSPDNKAHG
jgi:hypothetical protein